MWFAAVVAIAGVCVLALYLHSTPPQVVTLSDGTRLTVLRVTIDQHPKYCVGNPFQKVGSLLPGKAGYKLSGGTRYDAGRQERPVLAIWFICESTTNPWSAARFASEDGETWSCTRSLTTGTLRSNRVWGCIIADAWPRRAKEWNLQLSSGGGSRVTLRLPNPTIEHCEQWNPESLPAMRRVGETEIALQVVEVEPYPLLSPILKYSYETKSSRMGTLYFRISERGQTTNAWLPALITMEDATGNSVLGVDWNPPALASTPLVPPNTIAWSGGWPAVPGENAVKVVVDFVRQTDGVSYEVSMQRGMQSRSQSSTNHQSGHLRLEWIVPSGGTITNAVP